MTKQTITIPQYFQSLGICTGPLEKNSSHSHMGSIKNSLLGLPGMPPNSPALVFGSALHEAFLEDIWNEAYNQLDKALQQKVRQMVARLNKHAVVRSLMKGAIKEDKVYGWLHDVELSYILDAKQMGPRIGSDLKTTVAKSQAECIDKAIKYGYHKQAYLYKTLAKLKEFYFIFINKEPPYDIFIVSDSEFESEMDYAKKEIEFLLYMYKSYGNFEIKTKII